MLQETEDARYTSTREGTELISRIARFRIHVIQCRYCNYEPADQVRMPATRCPKCYQHTWERVLVLCAAEHVPHCTANLRTRMEARVAVFDYPARRHRLRR
jgi:hypothetical protein